MAPKKILLAEDDLDDQKIFCDFLLHRNDIVLLPVAENGVVVVDILEDLSQKNSLPDIIILDQNMPKKNGLQTLEYLQSTNNYAHIPVMIYSTYPNPQLIEACSKLGASTVVSKPVTKEGYNRMMDEFLNYIPQ